MSMTEAYQHIPFKECGRDRTGIDCYGLIRMVYQEAFNIELPGYTGRYDSTKEGDVMAALIAEEQALNWMPVDKHEVQRGDVVVLKILGRPWHCGIVLDYPKFLHIERGCDSVVERLDSVRWALRVEGFYRHKARVHA